MFPRVDDFATLIAELRRPVADLEIDADDAAHIDAIRALEELKSIVAAAQARITAAFVDSQRATQRAQGMPTERIGRGIAAQVGLARRISPHQAARYVGWVKILTAELPHTYAALRSGRVPEARALSVARETIWLSRAHRATVDAQLGPRLESLGDRQVETETRKLGYALDPAGYVARSRAAESDRHVSLRPAPDCMTRLSTLVPVKQGVAAYAALTRAAESARSAGDQRGRGQIMADTLIERVTGQATADQVPLHVNLLMTDQALFAAGPGADEPATVLAPGGPPGIVPAELARRAIADASGDSDIFLRRLYQHPTRDELAAMDSRSRVFTANQRLFLLLRDHTCRTPYCDAPARHADHIIPAENGGPTSIANGQSLCAACNHNKQAPGWQQSVQVGEITTITLTGHTYRSRPPRPPSSPPPRSPVETIIEGWLHAA